MFLPIENVKYVYRLAENVGWNCILESKGGLENYCQIIKKLIKWEEGEIFGSPAS